MVTGSTPIFASSDILTSLAFYKEVLGFQTSWTWGEPPTFGSVSFGPVSIMFNLLPELAAKVSGHQHWFNVEDADELYAMHIERGAKIVSPIEDRPWGVREYVVEDPDGYHLRFAGPLVTSAAPSQLFPEGVIIERGLPTAEEYEAIAGAAFYREGVSTEILEHSWNGVLARSADGQAIGMARIVHDAPGWFSVWDVAVLPDWQGRRIGQKLMVEALAMIGEASPGAWVYLFTYKHGFYERLGFAKETVSMRKV